MVNSRDLVLEKIIKLTRLSEEKFKQGNFKEAVLDRMEVKSILKSRFYDKEILEKFKEELSNIYLPKFDLIYDHKLRINELKKEEIVKMLEQKSEEKFKKGDYKGAIRALRRSEKYLSK